MSLLSYVNSQIIDAENSESAYKKIRQSFASSTVERISAMEAQQCAAARRAALVSVRDEIDNIIHNLESSLVGLVKDKKHLDPELVDPIDIRISILSGFITKLK